jgi:hypothetical protein
MEAAHWDRVEIVELLPDHGAGLLRKDKNGRRTLM